MSNLPNKKLNATGKKENSKSSQEELHSGLS